MIESHSYSTTSGAAVVLDSSNVKGQRFLDGHQNVQLHAYDLGGGAWSVDIRHPQGSRWVEHIASASEDDTVLIAGPTSPVFEALRVRFTGVPNGQVSKITLTTWSRAI